MSHKLRPTTIIDVAREAGVSPKTVSRVVTGSGYVSEETQQRVKKAIDLLDYRVNRAAQSLVSARSTIIGLIVPSVSNPFFPEVLAGVQKIALAHDYTLSVFETLDKPELERRALQALEAHRAAGVILYIPHLPDAELRTLVQRQNAVVLVAHNTLKELAGIVREDTYGAAKLAVNHLVEAQRRNIAYIDVPPSDAHINLERYRGLHDAMNTHHIPIVPEFFVHCEINTMEGSLHATELLLTRYPEINGVICHHDLLAYGVLEACDRMHISVPERVAVVGFDDVPYSGLQRISLTTIRFPKAEIGDEAAQMLFRRIAGKREPEEVILPTQLIQRGSTPSTKLC